MIFNLYIPKDEKDLLAAVDKLAKERDISRSKMVRKLLKAGLQALKKEA